MTQSLKKACIHFWLTSLPSLSIPFNLIDASVSTRLTSRSERDRYANLRDSEECFFRKFVQAAATGIGLLGRVHTGIRANALMILKILVLPPIVFVRFVPARSEFLATYTVVSDPNLGTQGTTLVKVRSPLLPALEGTA